MHFEVLSWTIIVAMCMSAKGEHFPSLLMTNASLAVVIDREYVGDEYENIKTQIETNLVAAKRQILKHGGVNVLFYSWSAINVKRDFTAIISIASCVDTWRLYRHAEEENLLHMAVSEPDCPRLPPDRAITIPLIDRGRELSQLLLDFKTAGIFKWKSVVIIYDQILNRDMSTEVIKSITQNFNKDEESSGVSTIKLRDNISRMDLKSVLSTIRLKAVGNNFLVIVSYDLVTTMMELAKSLDLVTTETQWLYLISDTDNNFHDIASFNKLLSEGDNVAFVYNTTVISNMCTAGRNCHLEELIKGFTTALDEAVKDEFDTASQVSEEEWEAIRPTKLERRDFLLRLVKKYILNHGICSNCTFWRIKSGDTWGGEYTRLGKKSTTILLSVGTWRPSDGASMSDELFLHVAHGFRKKQLPLATFHNPPWQILKVNESGSVVEYSGLVFDIIKELARNLNFTLRLELVNHIVRFNNSSSKEKYSLLTNEIPKEVLDRVTNKTVALGACAITITDEYKSVINYTNPISTQTYTLIVARPRELSRALLFISPFTGDTWLCICAAIISMGPFLYYVHRYSPVYEYKGIPKKGGLSSIQNCIWYMYGALLQQGGMHLPYADSARIAVGAWWLVVIIVATMYCGNLVAFLTFPKIDVPITSLSEMLARRHTVTWSFPEGSYIANQLKMSREPDFRQVYEGRVLVNSDADMIKDVKQGKHVYIDWKMKLGYIMKNDFLETGHCDFVLGVDEFFDERLALILPQGTPYLSKINQEIKKLHQVGLIHKWLTDYLAKRDRCWKNRHIIEVQNHTVNIDDMQGSFFVLFLGFMLAFLLLLSEKLWFKYFSKKKQKAIPFRS